MTTNDALRRDTGHGKIDFVDIAAPSYSPADNAVRKRKNSLAAGWVFRFLYV